MTDVTKSSPFSSLQTVENFKGLVKGSPGYGYKGTEFYRIVQGLQISAGDVLKNNGRSGKPAINDGEPFEQVEACFPCNDDDGLVDSRFFISTRREVDQGQTRSEGEEYLANLSFVKDIPRYSTTNMWYSSCSSCSSSTTTTNNSYSSSIPFNSASLSTTTTSSSSCHFPHGLIMNVLSHRLSSSSFSECRRLSDHLHLSIAAQRIDALETKSGLFDKGVNSGKPKEKVWRGDDGGEQGAATSSSSSAGAAGLVLVEEEGMRQRGRGRELAREAVD
eukprot:754735-Hanusia_phi.AAC.1